MHIEGIDHIGIASQDPARTRWFFSTALQLGVLAEESLPTQHVDTVTWSSAHGQKSQGLIARLELLIPSSADSTVAKFLDKRGGGMHHLSFRVRNLEQAISTLQRKGVRLINNTPQAGIEGSRIAFIHPHSTGGLLIELSENNP